MNLMKKKKKDSIITATIQTPSPPQSFKGFFWVGVGGENPLNYTSARAVLREGRSI